MRKIKHGMEIKGASHEGKAKRRKAAKKGGKRRKK